MNKKVYVTPRSITKFGHPDLKRLEDAGFEVIMGPAGKQPSEEEQLEILPQCVAYLAGVESISAKVLESAKHLKIISRNGVGIDRVDLGTAKRLGIPVEIAPGSNAQGVAELAISLMFSATREIPTCNANLKQGIWKREKGMEIAGRTMGIIGMGNIGKRVATMALGLGMYVIGYDLYPDESFQPSPKFQFTPFQEVIRNADVISLHCPPGETPLINGNTLGSMKNGIILINTARAGVVDNKEVLKAINRGKIRMFATDVFAQEPPEIDELYGHDRVIITPHVGGYTTESVDRALNVAIDFILEKFEGELFAD
jgi:D-3-phosphoglycerate dehydrogenase / 2-oxoglutarate reductase